MTDQPGLVDGLLQEVAGLSRQTAEAARQRRWQGIMLAVTALIAGVATVAAVWSLALLRASDDERACDIRDALVLVLDRIAAESDDPDTARARIPPLVDGLTPSGGC